MAPRCRGIAPDRGGVRGCRCMGRPRRQRGGVSHEGQACGRSLLGPRRLLSRDAGCPRRVLSARRPAGGRAAARDGGLGRQVARLGGAGHWIPVRGRAAAGNGLGPHRRRDGVLVCDPQHDGGGRVGDRRLRGEGLRLGAGLRWPRRGRPRTMCGGHLPVRPGGGVSSDRGWMGGRGDRGDVAREPDGGRRS